MKLTTSIFTPVKATELLCDRQLYGTLLMGNNSNSNVNLYEAFEDM